MRVKGLALSGAYYVDNEQKRTAEKLQRLYPERELPKVGEVILFNEVFKYQFKRECEPKRGIGRVIGFSKHIMCVEIIIQDDLKYVTSFQINEIKLEIVKYVKLSKILTRNDAKYDELDIENLSERIKKLLV